MFKQLKRPTARRWVDKVCISGENDFQMNYTLPVGEIVKLMERGQVTIPSKYRKRLQLTPKNPLNIFTWKGMVVIAPVDLRLRSQSPAVLKDTADWEYDSPSKYLEKVRYNPLEELWAQMARTR